MNDHDIAGRERLREADLSRGETGAERWNNLVEMFFDQAGRLGDAALLWRKTGGQWQSTSWNEAARKIAALAAALVAEGVRPGDRVVIVSESRPEFFLWDMAIMAAGAVSVPTYITNTARDHAHILENSGAVAAIVSTQKLARVLLEAVYQAPACRLVIGIENLRIGQTAGDVRVVEMEALLAAHPADVARVAANATMKRWQLACLIYTSGTGGTPRGVMQHHGAILHNIAACMDIIVHDFPESPGRETFLSFLPPSHAYEHTAGQMLPVAAGGQIYYAEGLDRLVVNIAEVRPTIMVVVPRLFEVMRQRIVKQIDKQGGLAPRLLDLALRLERVRQQKGRVGLINLPADFLVERLLRRRIRERFGGRIKALVSGGAPLNPEVGLFFQAAGLTLLQGYGQTEAGPVISCNRPAAGIRMDSVGPPLRDVEVRIADDGEILVAGELVMSGYWNNPVETARALQRGWLHTGDIGMLDQDGHLVITDRKKDIIVNDKGDTISPQRVEGMLTLQPEIMQAIVYGDRRPWLVGLLVPDAEFMQQWAAEMGRDIRHLHQDLDFLRAMQAAVDRVNAQLPVTEKVRRIILADQPFTVENSQMTPSLKPRRHVLKEKYGARLDALYR